MNLINMLKSDQRRELLNMQQQFEIYENLKATWRRQFTGSMRWVDRNGHEYLYRKVKTIEKSLGPKSPETEKIYETFRTERQDILQKIKSYELQVKNLSSRRAVALGIGRVPILTANIIRKLNDIGISGSAFHVVGTNALFAYEAEAGVLIEQGLTATDDADFLFDHRQNKRIGFIGDKCGIESVIKSLREIDKSFEIQNNKFRAENKDQFMVDIIRPEGKDPIVEKALAMTRDDNDFDPVGIKGLQWLVNAPKRSAIAIDETGKPLRINTIDPRAFALYKAWLSEQPTRNISKRPRDKDQAIVIAEMAISFFDLSFDSPDLSALPSDLRNRSVDLLSQQVEIDDPDSPENEIKLDFSL